MQSRSGPARVAAIAPRRRMLVAMALASAPFAGCGRDAADAAQAQAPPDILLYPNDDHVDEYGHHYHEPLTAPTWVEGTQAAFMHDDDGVVGFLADGTAYAIPDWVLDNHHVANFDVAGEPWLIVRCEVCSSAAAFDPRLDGARLAFRVCGIYNGTILLKELAAQSLWTPFLGECIDGVHVGRTLAARRVDQARWSEWLALHPETRVAFGSEDQRHGHSEAEFPGRDYLPSRMRAKIQHRDDRLGLHELVLGVVAGDHAEAFPLPRLDRTGPVVTTRLGDADVVVLHAPGALLAAAFAPAVDGRALTFHADGGRIVDRETGSTWDFAGRATAGPLAGQALAPLRYSLEEWYIWATQHPRTELFDHS